MSTYHMGAYKIVYNSDNSADKRAAEDLQKYVKIKATTTLELVPFTETDGLERCIVVGKIPGRLSRNLEYGECLVYGEDKTVYVEGKGICGLESGVSYLAAFLADRLLQVKEDMSSEAVAKAWEKALSELSYTDKIQERGAYEADSSAFLPCYRHSYTLPAEEISYDSKVKRINDPGDRSMVIAHRGEHIYYPENSLESMISAWKCGADSVETDVRWTRDGIGICMHDDTLTRTTDVLQKKGSNGLPDSELIADWTFEQIRQLRMLDAYGETTPFLVPSLEEVLLACNDKIFVHLDKTFDYEKDIFPVMEKYGIYKCMYLCNHIDYEGILRERDRYRKEDVRLQSFYRLWNRETFAEAADKIISGTYDITPALVYINDYYKNTLEDKVFVKNYAGKIRVGTWMMAHVDDPEHWREARSYGFSYFMTNYPIDMLLDIKGLND